jgi:putative ATP-dependent endonuclease of the OLD family
LIEEPETFLHPSAQQDLLDSIKDLSEDNQIIITTHSPIFA